MGQKYWLITNKGYFKETRKKLLMMSDIQVLFLYYSYLSHKSNLLVPSPPELSQKVIFSELASNIIEYKLHPEDPSILNLTENGWSIKIDEAGEIIVPFLYHTLNGIKQQVPFFVTTYYPFNHSLSEMIYSYLEGEGFVYHIMDIEEGRLNDALIEFSKERLGIEISEYKSWTELGENVGFDDEPFRDAEVYYSTCMNWEKFVLDILNEIGIEGRNLEGITEYYVNTTFDLNDNRIMPDTEFFVFSGPVKGFFKDFGIFVEDRNNNIIMTFPYLVSEFNEDWPICVLLLGRNHKISESVLERLTNCGKIEKEYSLNELNRLLPVKVKVYEKMEPFY